MPAVVNQYTKLTSSDKEGICKMNIDKLVQTYVKFHNNMDKTQLEKKIKTWKSTCK